jgi:hypothetical protein
MHISKGPRHSAAHAALLGGLAYIITSLNSRQPIFQPLFEILIYIQA